VPPHDIATPLTKKIRWTQFNKEALLAAVAKESPKDRDNLIEEFQEKWNKGSSIVLLLA
jgi:hypothetical protein